MPRLDGNQMTRILLNNLVRVLSGIPYGRLLQYRCSLMVKVEINVSQVATEELWSQKYAPRDNGTNNKDVRQAPIIGGR